MSVKLLAFDLDGTTLFANGVLPEKNLNALTAAVEKGIVLVPATGRIVSFIPKVITSIPGVRYAITANGGSVYDLLTHKTLHSALISAEKAIAVQKILNEYHLYTEYYIAGTAYTLDCSADYAIASFGLPESKRHFLTKKYNYVKDFDEFLATQLPMPEKINLPYLPHGIREEVWARTAMLGGLKLTSSMPDNMEINDDLATKGNALFALCTHLGISPDETMAIGDNGNDVEMLKFAGVSVAMGNSSSEAFSAAKNRTLTCENAGLALAIEKYALK